MLMSCDDSLALTLTLPKPSRLPEAKNHSFSFRPPCRGWRSRRHRSPRLNCRPCPLIRKIPGGWPVGEKLALTNPSACTNGPGRRRSLLRGIGCERASCVTACHARCAFWSASSLAGRAVPSHRSGSAGSPPSASRGQDRPAEPRLQHPPGDVGADGCRIEEWCARRPPCGRLAHQTLHTHDKL
jgi:hypothetical protein